MSKSKLFSKLFNKIFKKQKVFDPQNRNRNFMSTRYNLNTPNIDASDIIIKGGAGVTGAAGVKGVQNIIKNKKEKKETDASFGGAVGPNGVL